MGLYKDFFLPWLVDKGTSHSSLLDLRSDVAAEARGRVLEIGFGPGGSVPHYQGIEGLVALDPEPGMLRRGRGRISQARFPIQVVQARAEQLPFQDRSFDTVVSVLSLCSLRSLGRALYEVRRVLRPEGAFLFLEHGRAHDFYTAQWQRRLNRWHGMLFGCKLDVEIDRALIDAGFRVDVMEHVLLHEGPSLTSQFYRGVARHEEASTSTAWSPRTREETRAIVEAAPAVLAR